MLPDIENREDVWMIQRRGGAGFLLEAMEALRIGRECGWKNLDGDVAPEPRIARAIDLAHAACAKRADNLIGPEARTDSYRHGLGVIFLALALGPHPGPHARLPRVGARPQRELTLMPRLGFSGLGSAWPQALPPAR